MKTVQIEPQPVEQHAELPACAWRQDAGLAQTGLLHGGEHRQNGRGNGNGKGLGGSSFWGVKGDGLGRQVDVPHGDLRLRKPASGGQADLKGDAHPLLPGRKVGQGVAGAENLLIRKVGFDALGRGVAEAVVVQVAHGPVPQEPAVAMDPFHDFNVPQCLIAMDSPAGDTAAGLGTPGDVKFGHGRGKLLGGDLLLREEKVQPSPAVAVMDDSFGVGLIGEDEGQNPVIFGFNTFFIDGQGRSFAQGFGPVKWVAGHPRGGLGFPCALLGFEPQPKVRAVFSGENRRHDTSVTNRLKTQQK